MANYKVVNIIDSKTVVVNIGSANSAISMYDNFLIYELGDELFDPDTNESLGKLEIIKGKVKPIHIQEKMTTMQSYEIVKRPATNMEKATLGLASFSTLTLLGHSVDKATNFVEEIKKLTNIQVGDLVKKI